LSEKLLETRIISHRVPLPAVAQVVAVMPTAVIPSEVEGPSLIFRFNADPGSTGFLDYTALRSE